MSDFPPGGKRLWAERREWSNSVDFILFEKHANTVAHSTHIEMHIPSPEEDGMRIDPTFSMKSDEVQELMDNLWRIGFRPSEGTGSAGALLATQKHLEDMRKIAFDLLVKNGHQ